FSSRRRHTRFSRDWSSDVCSSDLEEGMKVIRDIRTIYNNYGFLTQILAASIRSPYHIVEAALAGADVATVPFAVIEKMLFHPLKIGRASCRERVEVVVGTGAWTLN